MERRISLWITFALGLCLSFANTNLAFGQFFKGKTIRIIVSSSAGGGNDTYTRLMARHMKGHIPGNPTIVVENMSGGGGLKAANYLWEQAPRDGTTFEQINWGVWYYQSIKDKRARFNFSKMNSVGAIVIENALIYCRTDRYTSIDQIRKGGKVATVGASGRQSTGFKLGRLIERVMGAKLFSYVMAYPGARQYSLALRQGEVDCSSNTKSSFYQQLGDMLKDGKLEVLAQSGTLKGKRDKDFPKTPTIEELATSKKGKEIADKALFFAHYGRPYVLPEGVPAARVKILRQAFDKTMEDPKFLSEAKRLHRPIDPLSGEELQKVIISDVHPDPEIYEMISEIFKPGKK
ncbi:MAG TPA: tripartite tricarboxylate transporter substrate-binding protein [Nitrospira sp.]|nr:tripartite tricarboxylate transporter substrate-binding protein [Nitrospira sp.]